MFGNAPISGETPLDDLSGLRDRSILTREQLNIAEAKNIALATEKYIARSPNKRLLRFDYAWLLRVHREMFGDVWTWAGMLRRVEVRPVGSPVSRIEVDLHELLNDLSAWDECGMEAVEQSCRLHHRAVLIHPFTNGNGRWSRLIANAWLRRCGHAIVRWPETLIGESSPIRGEYISAMRAADGNDYEPLLELHRAHVKQ